MQSESSTSQITRPLRSMTHLSGKQEHRQRVYRCCLAIERSCRLSAEQKGTCSCTACQRSTPKGDRCRTVWCRFEWQQQAAHSAKCCSISAGTLQGSSRQWHSLRQHVRRKKSKTESQIVRTVCHFGRCVNAQKLAWCTRRRTLTVRKIGPATRTRTQGAGMPG